MRCESQINDILPTFSSMHGVYVQLSNAFMDAEIGTMGVDTFRAISYAYWTVFEDICGLNP